MFIPLTIFLVIIGGVSIPFIITSVKANKILHGNEERGLFNQKLHSVAKVHFTIFWVYIVSVFLSLIAVILISGNFTLGTRDALLITLSCWGWIMYSLVFIPMIVTTALISSVYRRNASEAIPISLVPAKQYKTRGKIRDWAAFSTLVVCGIFGIICLTFVILSVQNNFSGAREISIVIAIVALIVALWVANNIFILVGKWHTFKKFDERGWKALIPFYSDVILWKKTTGKLIIFWVWLSLSVIVNIAQLSLIGWIVVTILQHPGGVAAVDTKAIAAMIVAPMEAIRLFSGAAGLAMLVFRCYFLYKIPQAFNMSPGHLALGLFLPCAFWLVIGFSKTNKYIGVTSGLSSNTVPNNTYTNTQHSQAALNINQTPMYTPGNESANYNNSVDSPTINKQ